MDRKADGILVERVKNPHVVHWTNTWNQRDVCVVYKMERKFDWVRNYFLRRLAPGEGSRSSRGTSVDRNSGWPKGRVPEAKPGDLSANHNPCHVGLKFNESTNQTTNTCQKKNKDLGPQLHTRQQDC